MLNPRVSARFWRILSLVTVVTAAFAILTTARVFSGTVDEPAHLAAGMQWLTTGDYTYDLQHPPLGRLAAAIGPYLHGVRTTGAPGVFDEGAALLGSGARYADTLASARHGEIVFFLLMALVVWKWARELTGEAGAAFAVVMLVANPIVLAHSGLATTDLSCAATTVLALYAAGWWVEQPTLRRSIGLGLAIGLAIASRLSSIAFVGAAFVTCYALRRVVVRSWKIARIDDARTAARLVATALLTCLLVIWAAYRFSFGPPHPGGIPVPAPAFMAGVETFLLHGSSGHPTFLLGRPGNHGWWYYFPVALLVKTPLALLLAVIVGIAGIVRVAKAARDWPATVPLCAAVTILAVSLTVKVDLGVRLILPIFPLLAIVAAQGALELWHQNSGRSTQAIVGLLVASLVFVAVRAYPDELSYFNALAGDHPEHVLVDSNLDWGQDLYRLRDTLAARGIRDSVLIAYFGTADPTAAGVPNARLLGLHERATGWIAASETFLAGEWVGPAYAWLLDYQPVARIGPSMRLWHIPPTAATTTDSSRR